MTRRVSQGLTLLELLFVLLICSILMLVCQMDLKEKITATSTHSDAQRFFQALNFARSAAIKGNQLITICPTKNQIDCDEDWSKGYMVFSDHEKLRVIQNHSQTHIQSKNTPLIQFSGDGRCLNRATFYIETAQQFKVVIYDSGRIRIAAP